LVLFLGLHILLLVNLGVKVNLLKLLQVELF